MWKDSYLVGIELIDDQHKQLFKAINNLKADLKITDKAHYKKQLYETITFLKDYCHTHFSEEQEYLQSIGFVGYEAHKQKHDDLLSDVTDYRNKLLKTNFDAPVVEGFLGFLTTWLIYHIGGEDQLIPKKEHKSPPKIIYDNIYHEYAENIKTVLNILAGFPVQNISYEFDKSNNLDSGVCFRVMLNGSKIHSGIDFIFSDRLAFGLVKEMTDMDAAEFIAVMYSALQEIAGIIAAIISGILSRDTGTGIDIELPRLIQISDIDNSAGGLLVQTELGAMQMFL